MFSIRCCDIKPTFSTNLFDSVGRSVGWSIQHAPMNFFHFLFCYQFVKISCDYKWSKFYLVFCISEITTNIWQYAHQHVQHVYIYVNFDKSLHRRVSCSYIFNTFTCCTLYSLLSIRSWIINKCSFEIHPHNIKIQTQLHW